MRNDRSEIELFQTFVFCIDLDKQLDVRKEMEDVSLDGLWRRVKHIEKRLEESSLPDNKGVIAFERDAIPECPAVQLALWPTQTENVESSGAVCKYRLGNIVALNGKALGVQRYNDSLQAFIDEIVSPVSQRCGLRVNVGPRFQRMSDLTSDEAATALRIFSAAANKSTGADHPADEARWREFIFQSHKAHGTLTASLLALWLVEVDKWDADTAHELACDWEKTQDLLKAYDAAA